MMNQITESKKAIQILQLIDQYGSIRQTAQKLFITQPAVSRYLIRLEKSVGAKLINRNAHPYQLTPAGLYYLQEEKKSYQHYVAMSQRLKLLGKTEFQQLNLGINSTLASILLPHIFPSFHHQYPGVLLNVIEESNNELNRQLLTGQIDAHIGVARNQLNHLQAASLFSAGVSLVIPKKLLPHNKHRLLTQEPTNQLGPLLDKLPVLTGVANSGSQGSIDEYLLTQNVNPEVIMSNISMIIGIALIKVAAGAMIVPDFLIKQNFSQTESKNFYFQPIQRDILSYTVKIYWNSWFKNHQVIQSLIDLVQANFPLAK